jgi:hypothetical protein
MALNNSPLNYTSIDLELEAIQRFRTLAPFLPRTCRVSRELDGNSTVLCLDFVDCQEEIASNMAEVAFLLALSSHYLRLADYIVFKVGDQIGKKLIVLDEIELSSSS